MQGDFMGWASILSRDGENAFYAWTLYTLTSVHKLNMNMEAIFAVMNTT